MVIQYQRLPSWWNCDVKTTKWTRYSKLSLKIRGDVWKSGLCDLDGVDCLGCHTENYKLPFNPVRVTKWMQLATPFAHNQELWRAEGCMRDVWVNNEQVYGFGIRDDEIEKFLKPYKESQYTYYWYTEIRCDEDTLVVFQLIDEVASNE